MPEFVSAFGAAMTVILASELGDKTFILTTIMAMKFQKSAVLLGAISAASLMVGISVMLGFLTALIPSNVTHWISIGLFSYFGVQMIREGLEMTDEDEQLEGKLDNVAMKLGENQNKKEVRNKKFGKFTNVFVETFAMNFLAEWGDRSQVSTVLLAAQENWIGIALGSIAGQMICVSVAVLGGAFIQRLISVRKVTIIGGAVFLIFAANPLIISFVENASHIFS